jgi:glycosyltransferase involved in cell wall biosynthesis
LRVLLLGRYTAWDNRAFGGDIHAQKLADNLGALGCKVDFCNASNFSGRESINFLKVEYCRFRNTPYYPLLKLDNVVEYDVVHGFSTTGYIFRIINKFRSSSSLSRPLMVQSQLVSRLAALGVKHPAELLLRLKPFRFLAWRMERDACRHADVVVVTSQAVKECIVKEFDLPNSKVQVIPRGVDVEHFKPTRLPEDKVILTVCRLEIEKGIQHLIESVKYLHKSHKDISLHIVGSGKDERRLKEMAKGCSYVRFLGKVPHQDMPKIYASCRVFVLPSLFEPFGAVLLEAMASARPVIAVNTGGPRDIVTPDCGVLVNFGDVDQLAAAVDNLLHDRKKAERMGLMGRDRVQKEYTWEKEAEKYLRLYRGETAKL